MAILHAFGLIVVILLIVSVTVGDDLQSLWHRLFDFFHPTDRALRSIHQQTQRIDYRSDYHS